MVNNKIRLNPRKFFHQRVVIDTSVLLKAFLKEEGSDVVDELLKMHLKRELTLLATPLIIFEFLNVMSKTTSDPQKVSLAFKKIKKLGIAMIEIEDKYVNKAIFDVCEHPDISYYDASYHALAEDLDAIFLTADKKYYTSMNWKGKVELFG